MTITNILFDADGVLQYATQHWQPALHSLLQLDDEAQARTVVEAILAAETEVLHTTSGFTERLEQALARWGREKLVAQTLEVLHAIEVHADVMQTVQALRRSGIPCHIGSNQQAMRATHMSIGLDYRSLFDREFYSCFVGAAKPQAAFFDRVVAQLGCPAGAVLFLDDRPENVEGARAAGLNATLYFGNEGAASLRRRLAHFGVMVEPAAGRQRPNRRKGLQSTG